MALSNKRITKLLMRMGGCAGWSAPLLFANSKDEFSSVQAHIVSNSIENSICLEVVKQTMHGALLNK